MCLLYYFCNTIHKVITVCFSMIRLGVKMLLCKFTYYDIKIILNVIFIILAPIDFIQIMLYICV